ncbi:MAG: MMPL family transporter, partial [Thermomicrobiales bacterium]
MAQVPTDSNPSQRDDFLTRLLHGWGQFVCHHARPTLIVPVLIAAACVPVAISVEDGLSTGGWLPAAAESVLVENRLSEEFGRHSTAHYILFSDPSGHLVATDIAFQREVERTVSSLRRDPSVSAIHTWGTSANPALRPLLISDDERQSLAIVMVDQEIQESAADVPELRIVLQSDALDVQIGGWPAITNEFQDLTASDLARAELISIPITLAVLLVVFGGIAVAGVPLVATVLTLLPTLAVVAIVARYIETSVFTINVVVMIGLAIGIDYALIFVTRYREQLAVGEREEAIGIAMATAGRTIVVSGAAVAIGLLGLMTLGAEAATATALAGASVVVLGVLVSLTALPAALFLLRDRALGRQVVPDRLMSEVRNRLGRFTVATRSLLDRHPGFALIATCALLLLFAAPVLDTKPELPTMEVLPESQSSRQMYETVQAEFSSSTLSPIAIIVEPRNNQQMTTPRNLRALAEFAAVLVGIEGVDHVVSVWSFVPPVIGASFLSGGMRVDEDIAAVVRPYLTDNAAAIQVNLDAEAGSDTARDILETIRNEHRAMTDGAFTVMVGGEAATSADLIDHLSERMPWTIGFVLLATSLVLFLQFRSVLLPIKAILLNLLSLSASFGALVWVFQQGNLSSILGFEPLGYTIVIVPVLMFCLMFGLSMDYEVIMLSRIREAWLETGDNDRAIEMGLRRSARIVTSAALIMLIVFGAFGGSELQVIQQIGIGLALAVFIDATLIRLIALPAAMRLMGRWNWWA